MVDLKRFIKIELVQNDIFLFKKNAKEDFLLES